MGWVVFGGGVMWIDWGLNGVVGVEWGYESEVD